MNFNNNDIINLFDSLNLDEEIQLSQIPDIPLYIDQIIQLFESNLGNSKRNEGDKLLTKTMINNYAKDKLLFPIKNKKYTKAHILLIILTYDMKQILSISDIKEIFAPMIEQLSKEDEEFDIKDLYEKYLHIKSLQISREREQISLLVNDISKVYSFNSENNIISNENDDYKSLLSLVLCLLNSANINKRLAEKIIDTYFKTT